MYTDKPTDLTTNLTVESWVGKLTMVACEMEAVPLPTLNWSHPGNETVTVNGSKVTSRLYFRPKSSSDFGYYKCVGTNIVGSTSVTILLVKMGK